MILCGTGHRPEDIKESEDEVRAKIRSALLELSPDKVITGMASGLDLYIGCEAIELGIDTIAAKPWKGHSSRRGEEFEYALIIEGASKVVNVDESLDYPGPWVYHKRNEWMVDHATHVLAYWSGKESGGTYACLKYANKVGRPVRNIYG